MFRKHIVRESHYLALEQTVQADREASSCIHVAALSVSRDSLASGPSTKTSLLKDCNGLCIVGPEFHQVLRELSIGPKGFRLGLHT